MSTRETAENVATRRVEILSPLLYGEQDSALRTQLIKGICKKEGLSERTVRRWLFAYKHEGFQGLLPKSRSSNKQGSVTEEILDEAVILRREVPTRSVRQIINILEMEGP